MRNLYIHCGLPKTGTTSIQKSLSNARQDLADGGIAYPDLGLNSDRSAHHNLAREIMKDAKFDPQQGTIADFLCYLRAPERLANVIISSEGLTHCLFRAPAPLHDFFRACIERNDAVYAIFTFRKFWMVVESTYLYDLRHGSDNGRQPVRMARTSRWIRQLSHALAELRAATPTLQFISCDVENFGGDAIGALKSVPGITLPIPSPPRRFNARVGLKKAALLLRLQRGNRTRFQSVQEYSKARRSIVAMPDFRDETFDYHVVPFDVANEIQRLAREQLPAFVTREIAKSLEPETDHYSVADLQNLQLTDDDIVLMRSALPEGLALYLQHLNRS